MTNQKILDKISKLKAHAESAAKIGSEAEAQAFATMIQQLLLKYKLSMTDVELKTEDADDPVTHRDVEWQDIKVRKNRVAWIESLAEVVAKAHFCRILVYSGSSRIALVGRESDVAMAEFLLVTLTRAIEQIAEKEYNKAFYSLYRRGGDGKEKVVRGFKGSFVSAFVARLAERFDEETRRAEASSSTAIALFDRTREAVRVYLRANLRTRHAAMVRGSRHDHNAEGWRRGRAAADDVRLRPGVVSGSKAPNQLS